MFTSRPLLLTAALLATSAVALAQPPGAPPQVDTIDAAVTRICEKIGGELLDREQTSVALARFQVHPAVTADAGVRKLFLDKLSVKGITHNKRSGHVLHGRLGVTGPPDQLLIEATLEDSSGTILGANAKAQFAVANAAENATALGISVDLDFKQTEEQRRVQVGRQAGTDLFYDANEGWVAKTRVTPFAVRLITDKRTHAAFEMVDGEPFVRLPLGSTYTLELRNETDFEAAAEIRIDGINSNVFSIQKDQFGRIVKPQHWLIPPKSTVRVPGWYRDKTTAFSFEVTTASDSEAARLQGPDDEIGTLCVTFAATWKPGETPPPGDSDKQSVGGGGTKKGFVRKSQTTLVQRNVGKVRSVVCLNYDLK